MTNKYGPWIAFNEGDTPPADVMVQVQLDRYTREHASTLPPEEAKNVNWTRYYPADIVVTNYRIIQQPVRGEVVRRSPKGTKAMTDAELDALIADLRHGTLDVETGEKMDAGEWAHIAIEEVDATIQGITYLRAQLAERDALGAVVMRERAIDVLDDTVTGPSINSWVAIDRASNAIYALPLPTHAEQLAHALTLPEIKTLVEAALLSKECFEFQFGVFRRYGCDVRMITPIKQLTAALAQMEGK